MILLLGTVVLLGACYPVDLIADGRDTAEDVGDLDVDNDADFLYVEYSTVNGWELAETHLHIVLAEDDETINYGIDAIPQTKKGNLIPGKFAWKMEHDPTVTIYEYMIPLADIPADVGDFICIAAHAAVVKDIGDIEPEIIEETAWIEGMDAVAGGNWAMVNLYEIVSEVPD